MKTTVITALTLVIGLLTPVADAEITAVSGPVSDTLPPDSGSLPAIIDPPTDVLDDFVSNTGQQGFDEAKVVTTAAHSTDSGALPIGVLVSSHMIFLNARANVTAIAHPGVTWTFSQPILGVMSDVDGAREFASTPELGAPGTNYPDPLVSFPLRGLEVTGQVPPDAYSVSGNQITVSMYVAEPGDWIRVVTCARGSQGFWKNNPDAWPVDEITVGGVTYEMADAIEIMQMPTKGDKTLTMFPQVVAAKLNMMTTGEECVPDCLQEINETIGAADEWMEAHPAGSGVKAKDDAWKDAELLYDILDAFNNEELTCDD